MSVNILDCGVNIQDLAHLLAASVIKDTNGTKFLRVKITVHAYSETDPAIDCSVYTSPEELLRECFTVEGDNLIFNISVPEIPT
jgi:hypothetical protein